jgi:hypothetical protein
MHDLTEVPTVHRLSPDRPWPCKHAEGSGAGAQFEELSPIDLFHGLEPQRGDTVWVGIIPCATVRPDNSQFRLFVIPARSHLLPKFRDPNCHS